MIQFYPLNSNAKHYPKPLIPVLPVADYSSFTLKTNNKTESLFLQKGRFYSNARSALANALSLANVNINSAVLMPAYHCGSMLEPAIWLKADILLYKMNKDLSPNTSHIRHQIKNSEKTIAAMLIPHYFGFLQDLNYWRAFCDQYNIVLIEDCAHAFLGHFNDNSTIGAKGHFAIASVRKFFCTPDGGILITQNEKKTAPPCKAQSKLKQFISLLRFFQQSFYYNRFSVIGSLISYIEKLRSIYNPPTTKERYISTSIHKNKPLPQWKWFNPTHVNLKGNMFSQWLMKHTDLKQITDKRKKNYLTLLDGINNIQHLKPLFQTLPTNIIPYMFPVLLTSNEKDFDSLKRIGMPIWRWEELAESDCPTSQYYRLKLLHLPCHQELKPSEITWMLNTLEQTLGKK